MVRPCKNKFRVAILDRKAWERWLLGILSEPEELHKALREAQDSVNEANALLLEELEAFDRLIAEHEA